MGKWKEPYNLCEHGNPAELNCKSCEPTVSKTDSKVSKSEKLIEPTTTPADMERNEASVLY